MDGFGGGNGQPSAHAAAAGTAGAAGAPAGAPAGARTGVRVDVELQRGRQTVQQLGQRRDAFGRHDRPGQVLRRVDDVARRLGLA